MTRILFALSTLLIAFGLNAQTPAIVDNGILNGASFVQGATPGSLVSIFGDNLSTQLASASSIPFSVALAGVSVTFNGIPAPISDVIPDSPTSHSQINAQVPWDALGGTTLEGSVAVVVTRDNVKSAPQQVQLSQFAPAIFTIPPAVGNVIAVNNADGSFVAPAGYIPGFNCHPAKPGDVIIFYANGLGPVDSPLANGASSSDTLRNVRTMPTVIIGGISVTPLFAGLAPQYPGVNQINVVIPPGAPTGDKVLVQLQVGGITTQRESTIAIQ